MQILSHAGIVGFKRAGLLAFIGHLILRFGQFMIIEELLKPSVNKSWLISADDGPLIVTVVNKLSDAKVTETHSHLHGQLLGTVQGFISISAEQKRWVIPASNGVWIPPDVPHGLLSSHGPFTGWSVYVAHSECVNLPDKPCILELSGLLCEAVSRTALWNDVELDPVQARLAGVIIDEIRTLPKVSVSLPMPQDARLWRIACALLNRPADSRRVEEWAKWAGVSTRTLTRRFFKETGLNFSIWRQQVRLLSALEMLTTGNR